MTPALCWHCFRRRWLEWHEWGTVGAWLCHACWREQQRENRARGAA